jgi:hypothetical protein
MNNFYLLPILLQGLLMTLDEFIFHQSRMLPRWERIGHPVDTLLFLLPILNLMTRPNADLYMFLSILSCLVITKDEFIHSHLCSGVEQWIHSLLFILHPISLFCLWKISSEKGQLIIYLIAFSILFLFIYQIFYWRPWWSQKRLLTMKSMSN